MLRNIMTLQLNINACNGTNLMGSCTGGHWLGFHSGDMLVLFGIQYQSPVFYLILIEVIASCSMLFACVLGGDLNSQPPYILCVGWYTILYNAYGVLFLVFQLKTSFPITEKKKKKKVFTLISS